MANAGNVDIVFSANVAQFVANVKRADETVLNSARTMESASARQLAAWDREMAAQGKRITKELEAARSSEMAALKADILSRSVLAEAEAAQRSAQANAQLADRLMAYSGTAQKATAATLELAASQRAASSGGTSLTNSSRAVSGAFMELEGRVPIRALERFLGTSAALAPVLAGAFEVVGVVAFAGAIAMLAEKAYNAYQNIVHLKDATEGLKSAELDVAKVVAKAGDATEQKIEEIIAKREGQAASLQQRLSYQSNKGLDLSEYFYSKPVKELPDDVKGNYENLYKSVAPADVPARLSKITAEVTNLQKALEFNKQGLFGESITSVGDFGATGKRDPVAYMAARLEMAKQIQAQLAALSDERTAGLQSTSTDQGAAAQHEAEERQRKAEEAARKHAEAMRKAAADQMQGMEAQLTAMREDHQVGVAEEMQIWQSMLAAASAYPENLRKIYEKIGTENQEFYREMDRLAKQAVEQQKRDGAEYAKALHDLEEIDNQFARAQHREQNAMAESAAIAEKNEDAMLQLTVAHQVATGAITRHDAAMQIAAAHAATYAAQLSAIEDERKNNNADPSISDEARDAANEQLNNKRDTVQGEADRQALQDKWTEFQTTGLGGAVTALQEFIAATKDVSKQWKDLTGETVKGINDLLVKGITTPHFHWRQSLGNYGASEFSKVSAFGVEKAEGGLLGGIPGIKDAQSKFDDFMGKHGEKFGRPQGTNSDPLYVKFASAAASVQAGNSDALNAIANFRSLAKMPLPDIGNLTRMGDDSDGDSDENSTLQGLGQSLFSGFKMPNVVSSGNGSGSGGTGSLIAGLLSGFIPGFADGVTNYSGGMAWVGERGPELLHLPSGASVTPNSKLPGSGDTHQHFHIDARGASDPAAVRAQVMQGIREAAPHLMRATASAIRSDRMRTPPTRRG